MWCSQPSSHSRFTTDFDSLGKLGKGGFGEVVKAKNKLDGVIYAIKVIKLEDVAENRKILREVTTVSRLYHRHIVRYYQAWLEGGKAGGSLSESDDDEGDELSDSDSECSDESGSDEDEDEDDWMANSHSSLGTGTRSKSKSGSGKRDYRKPRGLSAVSDRTQDDSDEGDSDSEEDDSDDEIPVGGFVPRPRASDPLGIPDPTLDRGLMLGQLVGTGAVAGITRRASSGKPKPPPEVPSQYLYIQMEYCEGQTLRELIDKV